MEGINPSILFNHKNIYNGLIDNINNTINKKRCLYWLKVPLKW